MITARTLRETIEDKTEHPCALNCQTKLAKQNQSPLQGINETEQKYCYDKTATGFHCKYKQDDNPVNVKIGQHIHCYSACTFGKDHPTATQCQDKNATMQQATLIGETYCGHGKSHYFNCRFSCGIVKVPINGRLDWKMTKEFPRCTFEKKLVS